MILDEQNIIGIRIERKIRTAEHHGKIARVTADEHALADARTNALPSRVGVKETVLAAHEILAELRVVVISEVVEYPGRLTVVGHEPRHCGDGRENGRSVAVA